jgi:hypothetical protein
MNSLPGQSQDYPFSIESDRVKATATVSLLATTGRHRFR